ncbi:MAG: beta-ketoacyl-ACP synthase III [Bacillota bacterium]|nr:beta-ketoacyl-ACP synthase III [Bacillota bacterium]
MENVKIIGCGYAKAKVKVSNADLEKIVETNDEWIQQRTGIQTRYVTDEENTSDLAVKAAQKAIEDAGIPVEDIDMILVATTTPDCITPSTACLVQEKLGLNGKECTALDINAACSGYVYGITLASCLLEKYKTILVIGSETLSKILDWTDRNTCVLFGDGAGACILQKSESNRLFSYTKSNGDVNGVLMAQGLPIKKPLENGTKDYGYVQMDGKEVFRFAVKAMQESVEKVLEKANVSLEDVDLIIPHQANIRIIRHVAKKMRLAEEKFFVNLEEFGNTSSASIAIALACAKEQGKLQPGMKIVLTGFGAGFTCGAVYIEW